ncbi:MAG: Flp family type IVb pilin [Desulfuromonadales bacterium]
MKIKTSIANLIYEEEGATMVEYAIMVGFIAAVCVGIVATLGGNVLALFEKVPDF